MSSLAHWAFKSTLRTLNQSSNKIQSHWNELTTNQKGKEFLLSPLYLHRIGEAQKSAISSFGPPQVVVGDPYCKGTLFYIVRLSLTLKSIRHMWKTHRLLQERKYLGASRLKCKRPKSSSNHCLNLKRKPQSL